MKSGGDITLLDNGFASPLYYAAKYGRIECVRYLLLKHKENERKTVTCHYVDVPCKAPKWETPLWVAVRQGYVEIVALLVTSGCHLEQRDPNGWTVLHAACKRSNVEVVKTLLKVCRLCGYCNGCVEFVSDRIIGIYVLHGYDSVL